MKKNSPWICLVLGVCLLTACSNSTTEEKDEKETSALTPDKPVPVRVVKLNLSEFHHDLITNGSIASQQRADLQFKSSENISKIYVKNGDRVNQGQKLAELDRFQLHNAVLQAKDNLERARLELQDVLIGQGYTLRDSLKVPAEVMKIARVRSNYDQNLNNYRVAEYNYRNAVLCAPFAGVVANLTAKEHNRPSGSEPFCTIIDNKHPEVEFKILESELPLVNKGDKIKVSPYAITNFSSTGMVTEINPVIDKYGMVSVKAALPASDKLMEGMNVKIQIQRRVAAQLVIPKEALVLRTNRKVVFTLRNGQAMWNYVTTGLENASGYVVTEGLQEGDSVIYDGNINLAHESPVTVLQ